MELVALTPAYTSQLAALIRSVLEEHHLDIPGTAYYDPQLDDLADYYARLRSQGRGDYVVACDANGVVCGGAGFEAVEAIPGTAELQKLYVRSDRRGQGLGRCLLDTVERMALSQGYISLYAETHTNLQAALRMYKKLGFRQIERPSFVVHSTMNVFLIRDLTTSYEKAPGVKLV